MTFGALSWIPTAVLRITFLQLTWDAASLFQIVACNTFFWNLVFTSISTYWLLSSDHPSRLRAPKIMSYWPSPLSQCLPWEVSLYPLLLETWESGETIHLFLFCSIKWLRFSQMLGTNLLDSNYKFSSPQAWGEGKSTPHPPQEVVGTCLVTLSPQRNLQSV